MSQILHCVKNLPYSHLTSMHRIGLASIVWFPIINERKEINLQLMLFSVNNSSLYIPTRVCSSSPRGYKHDPVCCMWWFISAKFLSLIQLRFCSPFQENIWAGAQTLTIGQSLLSKKNYAFFQRYPFTLHTFWKYKASEDRENILYSLFQQFLFVCL